MDNPREMPRMCVEGDFLSIWECAECGAVVRDPDTHIGWHASRPWTQPTVVNNLTCVCGRNMPCRHCDHPAVSTPDDDIAAILSQETFLHWHLADEQRRDCIKCRAADEIERLRAALDYAVSELLPVHDHWGEFDHHEVVAHFLEEARRG